MEKALRQRFGASIPRQRMCDWVAYAAESWLSIIYRSIRQGLLGGDYLQVDETPIRYLDTERKGKRDISGPSGAREAIFASTGASAGAERARTL